MRASCVVAAIVFMCGCAGSIATSDIVPEPFTVEAQHEYTVFVSSFVAAYHNLGIALGFEKDNRGKAIKILKMVVEMEPDTLSHRVALGDMYLRKGDYSKAKEQFRYVIERDPKSVKAHQGLAASLMQRSEGVLGVFEWLKLKGVDTEEALDVSRTAVSLDPDNAYSHRLLAFALVESGNSDEALEHVRRAIELHPEASVAHSQLGRILLDRGEKQEAIKALTTAAEHYDNIMLATEELRERPTGAITPYYIEELRKAIEKN